MPTGDTARRRRAVRAQARRHLRRRRRLRRHRRRRRRPVPRRHPAPVAVPPEHRRAAAGPARRRRSARTTCSSPPTSPTGRCRRSAGSRRRQGVIHIERTRLLWEDRLYERLRLRNYGQSLARLPLRLEFAADFRDMFEVRGLRRSARGGCCRPSSPTTRCVLRYEGLDGLQLSSAIAFGTPPTGCHADAAEFDVALPGRQPHRHLHRGRAERCGPPIARALSRGGGAGPRTRMRSLRRRGATRPQRPAGCSTSGSTSRAPTWRC